MTNLIDRLRAERELLLMSDGMALSNGRAKAIDDRIVRLCQRTLPMGGPATSEADTQQRIRVAASAAGYRMWRNNNGACYDETKRLIRYGVGNDSAGVSKVWKSPDLIGIGPGGVTVWCEVKRPDWQAPENDRDRAQWAALLDIVSMGGIGFFATSVQDYLMRVVKDE